MLARVLAKEVLAEHMEDGPQPSAPREGEGSGTSLIHCLNTADGGPRILVSKVLTYSDVSTDVARTGRMVLPRLQVQQHLGLLLALGGGGGAAQEGYAPGGPVRMSQDLVVWDTAGARWVLTLKTWQNVVSGEHRPTYVLENTASLIKSRMMRQGCLLSVCAEGGRLVVRSGPAPAPAPGGSRAGEPAAGGRVQEPQRGALDGGACPRTPGCRKAAGHKGFCTGHQGFVKKAEDPKTPTLAAQLAAGWRRKRSARVLQRQPHRHRLQLDQPALLAGTAAAQEKEAGEVVAGLSQPMGQQEAAVQAAECLMLLMKGRDAVAPSASSASAPAPVPAPHDVIISPKPLPKPPLGSIRPTAAVGAVEVGEDGSLCCTWNSTLRHPTPYGSRLGAREAAASPRSERLPASAVPPSTFGQPPALQTPTVACPAFTRGMPPSVAAAPQQQQPSTPAGAWPGTTGPPPAAGSTSPLSITHAQPAVRLDLARAGSQKHHPSQQLLRWQPLPTAPPPANPSLPQHHPPCDGQQRWQWGPGATGIPAVDFCQAPASHPFTPAAPCLASSRHGAPSGACTCLDAWLSKAAAPSPCWS